MKDFFILIFVVLVVIALISSRSESAGILTSYGNVATLNSADTFPVVNISSNLNKNINWYSLKEFMSSNVNWTDVKRATVSGGTGTTSGINWQDFRA